MLASLALIIQYLAYINLARDVAVLKHYLPLKHKLNLLAFFALCAVFNFALALYPKGHSVAFLGLY
jgi:hypothetical protein